MPRADTSHPCLKAVSRFATMADFFHFVQTHANLRCLRWTQSWEMDVATASDRCLVPPEGIRPSARIWRMAGSKALPIDQVKIYI